MTATHTPTLSPELAALIREKVESGRYGDANQVLEEAMQLLDDRDRLEWLRAEIAIGLEEIERGETVEYTPELMEQLKWEAIEAERNGEPIDDAVLPLGAPVRTGSTGRACDSPVHGREVGARAARRLRESP